jgi:anti-sigma B factor antagonist
MFPKTAVSALSLIVDRDADSAIVHCTGKLVSGVSDILNTRVKELIPGCKRIVLDLKDCTHMDSTGLGTVVRLYVSAKSAGCALELANIGKPIRNLLGVTHLISVLAIVGENNIRF